MAENKLTNESKREIEIVVIGGSAGSLSMVLKIVPLLSVELNVSVVIVFHRKQSEDNTLVDILSARTSYAVKEVDDKDELTPNTIYIAPPDYHLLIEKNKTLTLDDSEKVNYSRPSIDVTFESAVDAFGKSLACLLLSGANADGVAGLKTAKIAGSFIGVQDPGCAEVPYMPQQAILNIKPDLLLHHHNLEQLIACLKK